jgi:anthranilate synthase component 2
VLLLIDNFDSFVHNLARYLRRLGQETLVARNNAIDLDTISQLKPQAIILSPGPCTPNEAGCCLDVVKRFRGEIPILGVCLGHQAIGQALGAKIVRGPSPVHGRSSEITHHGNGLFQGLPQPMTVGRYHSLVIDRDSLPTELEATAATDDGVIMAVAHRRWPLYGVQFHPESVLTVGGYQILVNFLRLAGIEAASGIPDLAGEIRPVHADEQSYSYVPVA